MGHKYTNLDITSLGQKNLPLHLICSSYLHFLAFFKITKLFLSSNCLRSLRLKCGIHSASSTCLHLPLPASTCLHLLLPASTCCSPLPQLASTYLHLPPLCFLHLPQNASTCPEVEWWQGFSTRGKGKNTLLHLPPPVARPIVFQLLIFSCLNNTKQYKL